MILSDNKIELKYFLDNVNELIADSNDVLDYNRASAIETQYSESRRKTIHSSYSISIHPLI